MDTKTLLEGATVTWGEIEIIPSVCGKACCTFICPSPQDLINNDVPTDLLLNILKGILNNVHKIPIDREFEWEIKSANENPKVRLLFLFFPLGNGHSYSYPVTVDFGARNVQITLFPRTVVEFKR